MTVLRQTVRDHVVYYIANADQSWQGVLVEAGIAIVLFSVFVKLVGLIPSTEPE